MLFHNANYKGLEVIASLQRSAFLANEAQPHSSSRGPPVSRPSGRAARQGPGTTWGSSMESSGLARARTLNRPSYLGPNMDLEGLIAPWKAVVGCFEYCLALRKLRGSDRAFKGSVGL